MTNPVVLQLVAGLLLWSLISLGSASLGLYVQSREFWRSFWFMSGMWGWIDGGLAWSALLRPFPEPASLVPVLRFNAGLDVVYLLAAAFLMSRKAPRLRGFGLAVSLQGAFLLAFDVYFWWRCGRPT